MNIITPIPGILNKKRSLFLLLIIFSLFQASSCRKEARVLNDDFDVMLRLNPGKNNPRNSEADFITLKDGSILMAYSHFTGSSSDDDAPAYIAGRMSYDSGKTWLNDDLVLVPGDGRTNIMSVSFLRLQSGKIALFYVVKTSTQDCKPYMQISDDEARSWNAPVACISDKKGYFTLNNNRIVQLKNGRILLPVSQQTNESLEWNQHAIGRLSTYFSDDNGTTWKAGSYVPNYDNMLHQEPGVVELKDGKILLYFRTNQDRQYYSYSNDHGQTWSSVSPSTLRSPISPASITRIPATNDLIAVWNNNLSEDPTLKTVRTPLNLAISKDEGKTWENIKIIANNPDGLYCYTAIHFIDNHILLAHSAGSMRKRTGLSVLQITRVSLKWIYGQ